MSNDSPSTAPPLQNPSSAKRETPRWRRSSHCTDMDCVELARQEDRIEVRDSKHPNASHLALTPEQMAGLVAHIKAGELDSFLS